MSMGKKLNEADLELAKLQKKTEKELLTAYKGSLTKLRTELSAIYNKYGKDGVLTRVDMLKRDRLQKLYTLIINEMSALTGKATDVIEQSLMTQYDTSYLYTAYALETEAQIDASFAMLNQPVLKAAAQNTMADLTLTGIMKKNSRKIMSTIRQQILQGLVLGEPYSAMAKRITHAINMNATQALRVARTEAHRVQQAGRLEASDHAHKHGIGVWNVWDAALDSKTRSTHGTMDGTKVRPGENFHSPTGGSGPAPGQMGKASDDINCRCALRPELDTMAPTFRMARDANNKSVRVQAKTYAEWKKSLENDAKK